MYVGNLREGGPLAIETFCEVIETERCGNFSKFETGMCAVVYGDRTQLTHSYQFFNLENASLRR